MIKDSYSGKNSIICGDFNFHLDGELKDWPELAMIDRFKADGFIDTFRQVNPDDPGFTEDTDFNAMRWNQKLIEKQYRYDGILFKGAWKPTGSVLIGRDTECLTPEESEWFIKNMSYFTFYGRDMEVLFSKTKIAHSRRIFCKSAEVKKVITMKDLEKGFEMFLDNEEVKKRKETDLHKYMTNTMYV